MHKLLMCTREHSRFKVNALTMNSKSYFRKLHKDLGFISSLLICLVHRESPNQANTIYRWDDLPSQRHVMCPICFPNRFMLNNQNLSGF